MKIILLREKKTMFIKKRTNQGISIILALIMLISMLPVQAFATDTLENETEINISIDKISMLNDEGTLVPTEAIEVDSPYTVQVKIKNNSHIETSDLSVSLYYSTAMK